jgi:hypothetical protein
MQTIILAIGLSAKEVKIHSDNYLQVDIGELVSNTLSKGTSFDMSKTDLIQNFLTQNDSNVILGYAVDNAMEYSDLKQMLNGKSFQITQAYIRYIGNYQKYSEEYSKHSRWLDYSPDYIKSREQEYNQELHQLIDILRTDSIEIINIEV